ncbi:MAG: hypothetical protein PHO00_00455 [bacterium]|nr:hypothetical protein [bacterium]
MKKTFVILSYWGPPSNSMKNMKKDYGFGYFTPIDAENNLPAVLDRIRGMEPEASVIIVGVSNHKSYDIKAQKKAREISGLMKDKIDAKVFSYREMTRVRDLLTISGNGELTKYVEPGNPSQVKNLGLLAAEIAGAETIVLMDERNIIESKDFLDAAAGRIEKRLEDESIIYGVLGFTRGKRRAGFPDLGNCAWDEADAVKTLYAQTGGGVIAEGERIELGGCMMLHRKLFEKVPFDPFIESKEDIDYLISARMNGSGIAVCGDFLALLTDKGEEPGEYEKFRRDAASFIHMRKKIRTQKENPGEFTRVYITTLQPYPGKFLESGLLPKIRSTSAFLKSRDAASGEEGFSANAENILSKIESDYASDDDRFGKYDDFARDWRKLLNKVADFKDKVFG